MIEQQHYENKMLETFKLLGIETKQNREMAKAIYDRIKFNYTDDDLSAALESAMQAENPKINYPNLIKHLNSKRSIRLEEKARAEREASESGARKFWNMETEANCRTKNCRHCQHLVGRCDTIAKHTLDAINLIVKRKWPEKKNNEDWQEYYARMISEQRRYWKNITETLNKQFSGIGFDRDYDAEKKRILTREELRVILGGGVLPPPIHAERGQKQKLFEDGFIPEVEE
jgi:hypothetical protein